MKRIIVVFHDNNMHSGATMSMLTIVEYLVKKRELFEVLAVVPNKKGDLELYLKKLGIVVIKQYYGGNVYNANVCGIHSLKIKFICLFKTVISYISSVYVSKYLKDKSIDFVYSNTSTIYYGAWLSERIGAKHIWHFREFGLEDQNSIRIFDNYFKKLQYLICLISIIKKNMIYVIH